MVRLQTCQPAHPEIDLTRLGDLVAFFISLHCQCFDIDSEESHSVFSYLSERDFVH